MDDSLAKHSSHEKDVDATSDADTSVTEQGSHSPALAKQETKRVFRLRILVFVALLLAAVIVSVVVYRVSRNAEEDEFEAQFKGSAEKILNSFDHVISEKVAAIASLAVSITSFIQVPGQITPEGFFTVANYQERAATARALSNALYVSIHGIVTAQHRNAFEAYMLETHEGWMREAYDFQEKRGLDKLIIGNDPNNTYITPFIYERNYSGDFAIIPSQGPGPYVPITQTSPLLPWSGINVDLLKTPSAPRIQSCLETQDIVLGPTEFYPPGNATAAHPLTSFAATTLSLRAQKQIVYKGDPISNFIVPIFDSFDESNRTMVAIQSATVHWASYFEGILPPNVEGIIVVINNTCSKPYTYQVDGANVTAIGEGDLHDPKYEHLAMSTTYNDEELVIQDGSQHGIGLNQAGCVNTLIIYPSEKLHSQYTSNQPIYITLAIACIFVFTVILFIVYNRLVEDRQEVVMTTAVQSSAIVEELYPEAFRDRVMEKNQHNNSGGGGGGVSLLNNRFLSPNMRVKSFLSKSHAQDEDDQALLMSLDVEKPIADLFPHTTVMFADIAGFTSWSSSRDPAQVFILLQTLYQAFDRIAKRRKVFKVETIGDCYVAVAGLPNPQPNHALIMARFACQCCNRMKSIVRALEVRLGPDTAELGMRFGLHSGPVTAGVLRGERARFQLFGDVVNHASRVEQTGVPNRIHASQTTAALLIEAGKEDWLQERSDSVAAKGKGVLKTYWIVPRGATGSVAGSIVGSIIQGSVAGESAMGESLRRDHDDQLVAQEMKRTRLVNWMTELLMEHIKKVYARHAGKRSESAISKNTYHRDPNKTNLDEVVDTIKLPKFNASEVNQQMKHSEVDIPNEVFQQLRKLVTTISGFYLDNPFHNFEHACHVTMSVDKFLKRIVEPDLDLNVDDNAASRLHDYTHGINSDPMTHLAIILSALVHDAGHTGVSNAQLAKEDEALATLYRNKSVAEQNSLDISWNELMKDEYQELRSYMFLNRTELLRFRQILVNVVLATDIFDKELNGLRKNRWDQAFSEGSEKAPNHNDLRATIVIEHIIQASDVSHTMQHWHVYRKWNRNLFMEMTTAYRDGRMGADPSTFWYKGEIGFFDNYIIPLAKKLKECQVFGVSSDECLNYALMNRDEWKEKGEAIVAEMMEELRELEAHEDSDLDLVNPVDV